MNTGSELTSYSCPQTTGETLLSSSEILANLVVDYTKQDSFANSPERPRPLGAMNCYDFPVIVETR
jgi:hypothetical protein